MKYLLTLLLMVVSAINLNAVTYKNNYYNTQTELANKSRLQSGGMYSTSYYIDKNPKRVIGYTENDSINTTGNAGNPDPMWEDGFGYYYWNGHWYRKKGEYWSEWRTLFDWGFALWDWRSGKPGTDNPTQYYKDKPQPINDSIILYILACVYLYYKIAKQNKLKLLHSNVSCKGM
jgi:hypothetical protein